MAPVIAALCWVAGLAGATVCALALRPSDPEAGPLRVLAGAVVVGWVFLGATLSLLAVAGLAVDPGAALAPLAAALVILLRRGRAAWSLPRRLPPAGGRGWILTAGLLAAAAARLAWSVRWWPFGQPWSWDVYAVWGFKSRFLVSTGGLWRYLGLAGRYPFSHGDYPPLLPAQLAAVSWPSGSGFHAALPDLVLAAAALTLLFALWRPRLGGPGAAAVVLLVAWPTSLWGSHLVGLADRPLALLAGLAVSLILLGPRHADALLLATLLGGMGLLKDEGLIFAALLAAALLLRRETRRLWPALAAGLAPAAVWRAAMALLGPRSIVAANLHLGADFGHRLARVAEAAGRLLLAPDTLVVALAAAGAVLVLMAKPGRRWAALAVAVQVLLLLGVVATAAPDVDWQIATALPRLLVQMVPAGVACIAAAAASFARA